MNCKHAVVMISIGFFSLMSPCEEKTNSSKKLDDEIVCYANKYGPFQDIIVNNQIIFKSPNTTYCAQRYTFIKACIEHWCSLVDCHDTKQLTMLDLGAAQGYFSFKLAHELNIKAVMVEDNQSSYKTENGHEAFLMKLCKANQQCATMLLTQTINLQALHYLDLFEHFTIVLALNIVHYLKDWKECVDLIINLGDLAFIEVPLDYENDVIHAIHNYLARIHNVLHVSFTKPSQRKTVLYVFAKKMQPLRNGITYYNYVENKCLWPKIRQTHIAQIPCHLAPSDVTISHRGEVVLPRGVSSGGQIRSRL